VFFCVVVRVECDLQQVGVVLEGEYNRDVCVTGDVILIALSIGLMICLELEHKQTVTCAHLVPSNFVAHVVSFVHFCFSMVNVVFFATVSDSIGFTDRDNNVIPAR
jgi:hypothetical protein